MVQKSFHLESLVAPQHVINSARQFVSQNRESLSLAVSFFQTRHVGLSLRVVAQEQDGRFGECSFQMSVADLGTDEAIGFARRFFLRFHQTAIGDEILNPRKPADVVNLIEKDQRQDLADAGDRIQKMKGIRIVKLRMAQDLQFNFIQQAVVEIDAPEIKGDAGSDADVGEALGDAFPIALISDLFPDLGKVVLTVRVLNVGQQLGTLMHQMHAPAKQIASRTHVCGIDVGLRDHAAA